MEYGLVVLWLVSTMSLGAVALPVATWLFGPRWAGPLSFALALATVTVVGHLVGHLAFGWPALLAGLAVLVGASLWTGRRVSVDRASFAEGAVVFALGFCLVTAIRALDPAAAPLPLAVGEKMLDFGLVASLARAGTLPPTDMWFAGRPIQYHYGGHVTASLLGTLTGTPPRFTYNLALATFYGTLVATAYGLAVGIVTAYDAPTRVVGGLAAFFVGVAANLKPALQVLGWLLPASVGGPLLGLFGVTPPGADWSPGRVGEYWYFDASRVFPVDPRAQDPFQAATEFPLFAWLNGDLHAHMLSQPYTLLLAGLLLAAWPADEPTRRGALLLGAVPPVAGLVGLTNIWSFPTAGGLAVLTVLFAPWDPATLLTARLPIGDRLGPQDNWAVEEIRRVAFGLATGVLVIGLGLLWTLPYWTIVVAGGPSQTVTYWPPWTPLGGLLVVHGAFLLPIVAYVAARTASVLPRPALPVLAATVIGLGIALVGAPALGLFGPLLVGGWWLLRREAAGYETVLVVAVAGLVLLVELVTIQGERFNVVFKPYAQIWLFLSVAAAVTLGRFLRGWPGEPGAAVRRRLDTDRVATVARLCAVGLVVTTGAYAAIALPAHAATASPTADARGPTLDATAYVEVEYPAEAAAIDWLDAREGRRTIVTAAPGGYRWNPAEGKGSSAPASLTGHPTVLGWYHEEQYRGEKPYQRRLAAVQRIYSGEPDAQRRLLREYEVDYVYVGPAERNRYGAITVGELPGVTIAHQSGEVTIYRVHREQLSGG